MSNTRATAGAAALFFALQAATAWAQIVPAPLKVEPGEGHFSLSAASKVHFRRGDAGAAAAVAYLEDLWQRSNNLILQAGNPQDAAITVERVPGLLPEGYRLTVTPTQIRVEASSDEGLFYGAISLWQLLPPGEAGGSIPSQRIEDAPRFAWRGLMLDSARHFQSPAFVRRMIDWMAWHKLNVLHWHLTDDQGWRMQIRRYPRLTEVGAWRGKERYGGFYSQDEIRCIVAYAEARHVRIVPEVDLPGHATAAIAAYPALGAAREPLLVSERWGVHTHLLNLEPKTFTFIEDVLTEVMAVFPSHEIHIGGDEVVKTEWLENSGVQARAKALHLGADDIQRYFTRRMGAVVAAHGRRLVGWDEILTPTLDHDAIVMSWRGTDGARLAALAGNDTVLSPDPMLYFDHRQSSLRQEPPGRLAPLDTKSIFQFDPVDARLTSDQRRHIIGLQANIWTEHIQTESRVEWMALPRAAAVAENAWSSKADWPRFLRNLPLLLRRYKALHLNYADSVFGIDARFTREGEALHLSLANLAESAEAHPVIRFTLDGSEPVAGSASYEQPLTVSPGDLLRAATFLGDRRVSRVLDLPVDRHSGLRLDSHDLEACSNAVGLLLEPVNLPAGHAPLAVDILNPCWWQRNVDLSHGGHVVASVAALPFNYELGGEVVKLRPASGRGELQVHADACAAAPIATLPLSDAAPTGLTTLKSQRLPALAGHHDLCLTVARPTADPLWALDWIEITE